MCVCYMLQHIAVKIKIMAINVSSRKYARKSDPKEVARLATKAHNSKSSKDDGDVVLSGDEDVVENNVQEEVIDQHNIVEDSSEEVVEPSGDIDFSSMTKGELEEYARENLGIELDKRSKKSDLIDIIVEASK